MRTGPKFEANIDVTKVLKEHLYQGKNGKYLNLAFFENRDGADQYGNNGFIVQKVSKEARERGEKGPIIGNWKILDLPASTPAPTKPKPDNDDVLF